MALGNIGFYITQGLDVINNNLCKQGFLFILAFYPISQSEQSTLLLANLTLTVYVLPFFIFSFYAGKLIENKNKRKAMQIIKASDGFVILGVLASYALESPILTLAMLFLLGTKTAFITPAKFAYMAEHYSGNALLRSNNIIQTLSLSCILIAIMSVGFVVTYTDSPIIFAEVLLVISLVGLAASFTIEKSPTEPEHHQTLNRDSFRDMLKINPRLVPILIAIAWFWFMGASYMSQFINFVKFELGGSALQAALALCTFIVGMIFGALLAEKSRIKLATQTLITGICLSLVCFAIGQHESGSTQLNEGIFQLFTNSPTLLAILFVTGVISTLYVSPLYAALQRDTPKHAISRTMGLCSVANSALICLSTLFAFIVLGFMEAQLNEYFIWLSAANILFFLCYRKQIATI